jgi:hypothetical protein
VRAPAARAQINFHITGTRRFVADLQNGIAKIRAAFEAGEPGVKNADRFSAAGFQFTALQPLMLPDSLKQEFGRKMFVAQKVCGGGLLTPLGVKIFRWRDHFWE